MNDVATPARAEAGQTPLTAPLMVIRDIGSRFPAPLRKVRRPTTVKIIDEGMLDVDTARGLLEASVDASPFHLHRQVLTIILSQVPRLKLQFGLATRDHHARLG